MMMQHIEMAPMRLAQLFPLMNLSEEVGNIGVRGFSIDSRMIEPGYVFVATEGVNVHGKHYIPQAIERGAAAVLIRAEVQSSVYIENDTPIISLVDMEKKLSGIVGQFYGHPTKSSVVVGITGTNGKTTCSQLYAQLSALSGRVTGVMGTNGYGNCSLKHNSKSATHLSLTSTGMTTPDAIRVQAICAELTAAGSRNIVMEVSSHGIEQSRVAAVDFDGAIFTNLSHDHLDYHGDMETYGAVKTQLFTLPSLKFAVINLDDPFSTQLLSKIAPNVRVITYSILNPSADLFLSEIRYQAAATDATLHCRLGSFSLSSQLVGEFNLSNLLAVLGAFYPEEATEKSVEEFSKLVLLAQYLVPVMGRLESVANRVNRQVVVDYAHTPDALKNVLLAVKKNAKAQVICVFGCGGDRDKEKRPAMARMAEKYADVVIVTSDNPRTENPQQIIDDVCRGFLGKNYQVAIDRKEAITAAITYSSKNDVVLIAGKGHEDYQLIGNKKIPFSDQSIARVALRSLEGGNDD